jgi:PAS domain S-box-containing protein
LMENDSDQTVGDSSLTRMLESQQMLEALISNSFDAIIAIDPDKKIIKFNRQAEILLGYIESEMIGQWVEGLHEDKHKAREIYRAIQDFGKVEHTDIVLIHKDGSKIPISLSGKLIEDQAGHILGQVGFLRDLREIQLFETRLKALVETSKAVNSTSESREILEYVVQSALKAIPAADRGSIHYFDEQSGKLNLMISSFDYSMNACEALRFEVGEGIAGWVFEHQQPALIRDAQPDARYKAVECPEVITHRSMICVPIIGKLRNIGVMSLCHSTQIDAFSSDDLALLIGFADQAAIAIENAEQLTKIRKEVDELSFLRTMSLKINAQVKIEEILTAIVESSNKLLGTEMAVVHWKGRNEGKIQTFVAPAELKNLMTEPRLGDGVTAEIFQHGEPVVVQDAVKDARSNPLVLDVGIQSFIGYPLLLRGRVAGVLFFNSRHRQFFGEHEIHLISLLLPLAAVAKAICSM